MIFNCRLAPAGDDDDLVASRSERFLHPILDDGFVDQRKHLLRLSLGGGKKSCAQPGGGKNRLAYDAVLTTIFVTAPFAIWSHAVTIVNAPVLRLSRTPCTAAVSA